jgi:hypothetical protein
MRINFDRLSQLAGIPASDNRKSLYEGVSPMDAIGEEAGDEAMETMYEEEELPEDAEEGDKLGEMMHGDPDEILEIDEVMLVQELRRAKNIMKEHKKRSLNESRKQRMFETQLKQVIDEEVQNVMEEMHLTGQWVYGNNKPKRSRQGYSHQGSMIPGVGFGKK